MTATAAIAVASTLYFTAPPASAAVQSRLEQCANGAPPSPTACTTGAAWQTGNLNGGNSTYHEGDSVPFRAVITGLTTGAGVHTLDIEYETTDGAQHAYDYLTTYSQTVGTANPCAGLTFTCGAQDTEGIPDDPLSSVVQIPGDITIWGATITGVTYQGIDADNRILRVSFNFVAPSSVGSTTGNVVIAWSGHLASSADWGAGNGASSVSGSSFHQGMGVDGGNPGSDRSIQVSGLAPLPTITTQVSNAAPNTGQPVTDLATFSGTNGAVTGTATFFVCGPAATPPDCTTGGTQVGSAVTIVNNTATSPGFTPTATGTYCFRVNYTPPQQDPNYSASSHTNLTTECFTAQAPPAPSLTLTKVADNGTVAAGGQIGYTITLTNAGPGTATNVVITDNLPGTTGLNWSLSPAVTGCGITGPVGTQVLSCTFATFGVTSQQIHVISNTTTTTCGTVSNQASFTSDNGGSGNSGTATAITVQCPNLTITKVADNGTVSAGGQIGYTITLTNAGPGTATNVVITDNLPGTTGLDWSLSPAVTGCGITGPVGTQVLSCTFATFGVTSQQIHVISGTTTTTCGTVSNQASFTSDNGGSGNSGTATAITVQCPNLTITKVADNGTVSAGSQIGYTITLTNAGPGTATNVVITDNLPGTTGLNWSLSPAVTGCGITGPVGTQVLSCTFATFGVTSQAIHVISGTTTATCGAVRNSASFTSDNGGSGSSTTNGGTLITVQCPNLTITKVADNDTVNAGGQIGYTITLTNAGPGTATNVVITDNLPGNTGLNWSLSPAVTGCGITGPVGTQVLSCTFATFAQGSQQIHVISGTSAATCGAVRNSASFTSDNAGSGSSTTNGGTLITVQCPNLNITKVADNATVSAGGQIGYTITLTNAGPGTATNVVITDNLPGNTGLNWSLSPGVTGCGITGPVGTQVLSCTFATFAQGSQAIHVISGTTTATCGTVSNAATFTSDNGGSGSSTANGGTVITVQCPNLSILKTADASPVTAGNPVGYTITVSNAGPGAATNVTINDVLPLAAGLNWSIASQTTNACVINGNAPAQETLSCAIASLASGTSYTVHVTSPTQTGPPCTPSITNTATAGASNNNPATVSSGSIPITITCPNVCVPTFTPTTTITGTHSSLIVSGNTVIQNATINGSIKVKPGSNVFINNSTITGNITSDKAASFALFGSTLVDLSVSTTSGQVLVGGLADGPVSQRGCAGNFIEDVSLYYNKSYVQFANNQARTLDAEVNSGGIKVVLNRLYGFGSMEVSRNVSSGPTLIMSNTMPGDIACFSNSPAPTNGGGANTVGGSRTGQCISPTF